MLPLLLIASQVYAPASSVTAFLIVRTPRPFTLVTDTLSPDGMLPQLSRQTIRGTGTPTASQMMVNVPLISTWISGTGGTTMDGGAVRAAISIFTIDCYHYRNRYQ